MNRSHAAPGAFALTAFAAAVVLGGANFVAVRFSNRELEPFWGAGLRFALAAMLFVGIAAALRLEWPSGRELRWMTVYGLMSFTLFYALMYWALVRVTAGLAAVVLAAVPLVTQLLAAVQGLESASRRTLAGALLALAGILWMTLTPTGLVLPLSGLLAMLAAALTAGQSVILAKRLSGHHPAITNAVAMSVGAAALLLVSLGVGEPWVVPSQPAVIGSVLYLVVFGSVGLFVLLLLVARRWTASATAYAFVLFPVVTMLLEAWLVDEPLTVRGVSGALIVMVAVWFGALAPSSDRREPSAQPTEGVVPETALPADR